MFGEAVAATVTVDAWAVAAIAAELPTIDPAALSATIAEATVRRMLMISPPWHRAFSGWETSIDRNHYVARLDYRIRALAFGQL